MTTPANLTFTDVQTRVMNNLRVLTTNTDQATRVAALINQVYRDVAAKSDWDFMLKRSVINTSPNLIAGAVNAFGVTAPTSVSLTVNSTTITFSSVIVQDVKGFVMIIPGQANDPDAVYRIAAHGGASATATLDAAYTDVTNATASFRLYQDSYSLPVDCLKVINVKRYGYRLPMERVGIEEMSGVKLSDQTSQSPQMYSVFDYATTGDPTTAKQLIVHPYPDKAYRMELFYKQMLNTELATTVRSFIPDDFVQLLVYGATALGYSIILNDEARSKMWTEKFNDVLALIVAQNKQYARDNPGIAPRDSYRRSTRRMRTSYTLGNLFDTLPDVP